jgi:hypothetical protein
MNSIPIILKILFYKDSTVPLSCLYVEFLVPVLLVLEHLMLWWQVCVFMYNMCKIKNNIYLLWPFYKL